MTPAQKLAAAKVLRDAAKLVSKPGAWTRRTFARVSPRGRACTVSSDNATCWCAEGAIYRVVGGDFERGDRIVSKVEQDLGKVLFRFNDSQRTAAPVIAAMRKTAARLTREAKR